LNKDKNIHQRINHLMGNVAYVKKNADIPMGGKSYKAVLHDDG